MKSLVDLLERAGWTFVQSFVGVLVGLDLTAGAIDWKTSLVSAAVAGLVAALKVLGVKGAQVTAVVDTAEKVPAVHRWTEHTPVGQTTEEIARRVARELTDQR